MLDPGAQVLKIEVTLDPAQNAIDVIQADVCRVRGITDWLEIAHLAAAYNKTVSPRYLVEISIAVLCAVPNGEWLEWVRGRSFSEMGLLVEPLRLVGGGAFPFQTPGHGIRFRWDQSAQFEVSNGLHDVYDGINLFSNVPPVPPSANYGSTIESGVATG